jgi:hypothetical protein
MMSNLKRRLERIELNHAMRGWQVEMTIVNPRSFDGEMSPDERERHRLEVLRVARNPRGVLVTFVSEGEQDRKHLLELLGPADYSTIARHASTTIERNYGVN